MGNKNKETKPVDVDVVKTENVNEVKEEVKTDVKVDENKDIKVEEVKKVEQPKTEVKPAPAPAAKVEPPKPEVKVENKPVQDVKVGSLVKIKKTTKTTVTGQELPMFAYRNTYKVTKILPSRVIISAGTLTIAVTVNDIEIC